MSPKVINVVLSHQSKDQIHNMVNYWNTLFPAIDILIAYGGKRAEFDAIEGVEKIYIHDERLRTTDHQRECQSYGGVFSEVSAALKNRSYDFVYFTEFDHIPIAKNLHRELIDRIDSERADVLFHHLKRVDASSNVHALYHASKKNYHSFVESLSVREDSRVMLTALGFGQFWKRTCFDQVARIHDEIGIYLEIWMPTMAHHLGYRVRGMGEQDEYNQYYGELSNMEIEQYSQAGALCVHPVKKYW